MLNNETQTYSFVSNCDQLNSSALICVHLWPISLCIFVLFLAKQIDLRQSAFLCGQFLSVFFCYFVSFRGPISLCIFYVFSRLFVAKSN
jgi:hypothetical protein